MRFLFRRFFSLIFVLLLTLPAGTALAADKVVALTFDDGPSASYTAELLDTLSAYGAQATFFVLGNHIKGNEAILERMVREGHEIASHTYSHKRLTELSASAIEKELEKNAKAIYDAVGIYPSLVRPPYGSVNKTVKNVCADMGYSIVLWDVDTRDWASKDYEAVAKKAIASIESGDIVLFHDRKATGVKAAALVIETLSAQGYRFVTVSELQGLSIKSGAAAKADNEGASMPAAEEDTYSGRSGLTTGSVNLRTGPSTAYKKLLLLPRRTSVEVLDKYGSWYRVSYNGQIGYVYAKYLKLT